MRKILVAGLILLASLLIFYKVVLPKTVKTAVVEVVDEQRNVEEEKLRKFLEEQRNKPKPKSTYEMRF